MPELSLVPVLALGLFAGLRASELRALDWSEVDLEERIIEVKGKKAKTRQRKHGKISDNLLAWLKPHSKTSGSVVNGRFRERLGNAVAQGRTRLCDSGDEKGLGKWPKNGMRHSFASYNLSNHQNAALTALELGHADTDHAVRSLSQFGETQGSSLLLAHSARGEQQRRRAGDRAGGFSS